MAGKMFYCRKIGCDRGLTLQNNRTRHEKTCSKESAPTAGKIFYCKNAWCSALFQRKFNCTRHENDCARPVDQSQQKTCYLCKRTFSSLYNLKQHLETHTKNCKTVKREKRCEIENASEQVSTSMVLDTRVTEIGSQDTNRIEIFDNEEYNPSRSILSDNIFVENNNDTQNIKNTQDN